MRCKRNLSMRTIILSRFDFALRKRRPDGFVNNVDAQLLEAKQKQ